MASYSKSGIEKLSVYDDMVNTQLWLLAARNRVYNTCNATLPSRIKAAEAQEICKNADKIYDTMFNKAKELTTKLDLEIQSAKHKNDKENSSARQIAKKLHKLNRNTMRAVCFLSATAIEHEGYQPEDGPDVTPAMDPKKVLDMTSYSAKLAAAAKDLA